MKVVDPVCKMSLEDKWSAYESEYKGKTYHFCKKACRGKSLEDPEMYIQQGA